MIINDKEYEVNSEKEFVSLIKELNGDKNPMECSYELFCDKYEYDIVLSMFVKVIKETMTHPSGLPIYISNESKNSINIENNLSYKLIRFSSLFVKDLGFLKIHEDKNLNNKLFEKTLEELKIKYKNGQ